MKNLLVSFLVTILFSSQIIAQTEDYVRPASIGISAFIVDFRTPQKIRTSSLSTVLREDQWASLGQSSPGFALSYFKGLRNHIDFAGTLAGTYTRIPLSNNENISDQLLLEADASVNLKMFSDKYIFTPYLNLGVGVSHYNSEFGAFLPLGGGLKLNLFDEAAIFINSQYRVPVTKETNNYHFFHSIGIAGSIGRK